MPNLTGKTGDGTEKNGGNMYDLLFIIKPDLEEAVQKDIVEKVKSLIETTGGKIDTIDIWGKRELATMIEKDTHGYYVLIKYTGPGTINKEIENRFKINENIMRHMITLAVPQAVTTK
jgi:small subunit ribosomal protein S6